MLQDDKDTNAKPVTNTPSVTAACRHCGQMFEITRADQQFCKTVCRVAHYRKRNAPSPKVEWEGRVRRLGCHSRSTNADGTVAMSKEELGAMLLQIAERDDDGKPKTGRRYFYLALSHGYIRPNMGASDAAKKSRDAAYDRITDVLGVLRMNGSLSWEMVLDLTRELDEWQTYESPREARAAMRRQ
jgi:hypothetical protein